MTKQISRGKTHAVRAALALLLAAVLLMGLCPLPALAESTQGRVIRVGYYTAAGFQEYDEATGEYSGYSYEFLMALAQYTNWTYRFVPCGFSEGLQMLQDGEIDLMNNVSKTEERQQVMNFSSLNSGENVAYLAMQAGDTRVAMDDLQAMETIKIGLARDSLYSQRLLTYFEENGVNANITWYDTHATLEAAFHSGAVDAYIITSSTKKDEHIILSFSPDAYYIAVSPADETLAEEVDKAITTLRTNDPAFEVQLKEKYYGTAQEQYAVLTQDEQAYLAQNPTATVLYLSDWYPVSYTDENGEFAGALRGVYNLLEERTGLHFSYVADDNSEDVIAASGAQVLCEQPSDFSRAQAYGVKLTKSFITPPLMEVSNHILAPGDTVALVEGDYLSDIVTEKFGDKYQYSYCNSIEDCMKAVANKTAAATVLISYESEYYRQKHTYSTLQYTIIDVGSYSLSIAVLNSADPRLYSIIQKGLNAISEGEFSNIFNQTLLSLENADFGSVVLRYPVAALAIAATVLALLVGLLLGLYFVRRLKKQNAIIHEKNIELEKANKTTMNFLSRMSHDMRTPMNGILGISRLSHDETDPAQLKQSLAKIESSGEYLLSLINDTLDFQRIESGRMELHREVCSFQDLLQSILSLSRPAIVEKGVDFKVVNHGTIGSSYVLVDPVRFKQIFLNLLSNATKFTPQGGAIVLEHECMGTAEDGTAQEQFCVRDTGIGMSRAFIEQNMFHPFSQEQSEITGQYAGSGLGLSIVHSLVQLMGGTITVESEQGTGTTFTVTLPIQHVEEAKAQALLANKNAQQSGATADLHGKHILVAEDHPLNAEIAQRLLEKAGCTVTVVANGRLCVDAFTAAPAGTYQLVLMDIRMPVMDGLAAAKAIRALEREDAKQIPIIAMTANAYDEDKRQSAAAGMNAHLAKPIEPQQLYAVLAQYLCANA